MYVLRDAITCGIVATSETRPDHCDFPVFDGDRELYWCWEPINVPFASEPPCSVCGADAGPQGQCSYCTDH